MIHESASAGRSDHPQGRHSLPPHRHNSMEPDFLPVDEHAWQQDFQPEFQESNESRESSDLQMGGVDVQTKLFRRQHQFLFELRSPNAALKLPNYLSVSRSDSDTGYELRFSDGHPAEEESADKEIKLFRNSAVLESMRRADSPQAALSALRQFFRKKGIDVMRING